MAKIEIKGNLTYTVGIPFFKYDSSRGIAYTESSDSEGYSVSWSYLDDSENDWLAHPVPFTFNEFVEDFKNGVIQQYTTYYYRIPKSNIVIGAEVDYYWYVVLHFGLVDENLNFTEWKSYNVGRWNDIGFGVYFFDLTQYGWTQNPVLKIANIPNTITTNKTYIRQDYRGVMGNVENSIRFWESLPVPINPTPIPPNKEEGNEGDYDNSSDIINFPDLPTITPINNGMIHAYTISSSALTGLGNYLWSDDFFDNIVKLFQNPMDAIMGLYQCKYSPTVGDSVNIKVGNLDTGVQGQTILNNYTIVDCGTLTVNEYFGNSLDYSPNTTIKITLPYCGTKSLDTDLVMGSTIGVKYYIDCLSGQSVCYVYIAKTSNGTTLQAPIYSFPCECNAQIPMSSYNMSEIYSSVLGGISSIGGGAIALGSGNAIGVASSIGGLAGNVMGSKTSIEQMGSITGIGGLMANQKPYLIITRPINAYAEDYSKFNGLPCNITYTLNELTGFTKISQINLNNIDDATEDEKKELESLLKEGVYM